MWEKTVAGILVMLGAFGFGIALCQEMQCALYHFQEQKRMLLYMKREIAFLHKPMQEICDAAGRKLEEPYGSFVKQVAERMENGRGQSLYTIWNEESRKLGKLGKCPARAVESLIMIGNSFGCEEDEMQMETFLLVMNELEEDICKIKKEKEEKSRLIKLLSFMTGIFCIVLFL